MVDDRRSYARGDHHDLMINQTKPQQRVDDDNYLTRLLGGVHVSLGVKMWQNREKRSRGNRDEEEQKRDESELSQRGGEDI